ncbi:uncharacterized protein LOC124165107 [Ischnura elegans]|uniref:uncharacterized protein LOC124165107 n=1 Tax=Ischnura elegans TaxID=197161 RepID=UPI001ED895DE|nr:uncharacterized protein LOC124165107 [Ischnura elegans]
MDNFTSLLDCLLRGLQLSNKKTFIYRVVYVGQHTYQNLNQLFEYFKNNIQKCNSAFCDEKLSGFLLIYDSLLIHMVEGSEESIVNHFQILCDDMDNSADLSNLRVLIVWPHVPYRKTSNWFAYKGTPNESDNVITSTCQASPFVQQCLNSMCRLAEALDQKLEKGPSGKEIDGNTLTLETVPSELVSKLPETGQVMFLTTCSVLLTVHKMLESTSEIPRIPYSEIIWPTPSKYIPRDVLKDR